MLFYAVSCMFYAATLIFADDAQFVQMIPGLALYVQFLVIELS
jgi:hypothetical protein